MKPSMFIVLVSALLSLALAALLPKPEAALSDFSTRDLTYDLTAGDFSCPIANQESQDAAQPNWDYSHVAPSTSKQAFALAWEPLLEPVDDCNGLDDGWMKKFSFFVVLDQSWVNYYNDNKALFATQGYPTLETSAYVLLDRVNYLFQKQFSVSVSARIILPLPDLKEACATNNKYADDGSAETSSKTQLAAAGYSTTSEDAGIMRLGTGSVDGATYCHSYAPIGKLCTPNNIVTAMEKPFTDNGLLRYKAMSTLAHELGHYMGICTGSSAHCLNAHTANEIPDIMVWDGRPATGARPQGMFYKFFTTCTPLYRDQLCANVQSKLCGVDVAPVSLAGGFFCTKYEGRANNWHYVTVTETTKGRVYTWKNRANKSWTLTRQAGNADLFDVSQSCPYYSSGYTVAKIRKETVNGEEKVTGIYGPWNELYQLVN